MDIDNQNNSTTVDEIMAEVAQEEMSVIDALRVVIRKAQMHNGLKRGLHECVRELDRRAARLCCLASDCDNPEYVTLVESLCNENQVPLIKVDEGTQLGEWCGLFKLDTEGEIRKVVRCSCAVITDFGEDSQALTIISAHLRQQNNQA